MAIIYYERAHACYKWLEYVPDTEEEVEEIEEQEGEIEETEKFKGLSEEEFRKAEAIVNQFKSQKEKKKASDRVSSK